MAAKKPAPKSKPAKPAAAKAKKPAVKKPVKPVIEHVEQLVPEVVEQATKWVPPANDKLLMDKVRDALHSFGLEYDVMPCDDKLADTAAFCKEYGYTPEQSANTILVANKKFPAQVVACVVLADSKLDVNKTVCQLMGAKKASFAPADKTKELTGMEIGGVVIFGLPAAMPIYVDSRVFMQERVVMGGGNRTSKTVLAPDQLHKVPGVEIVPGLSLKA